MSCNGTILPFKKCSTAHHALRKPTMIKYHYNFPESLIASSHLFRAFCITFGQAMFCRKAHSNAWWHSRTWPSPTHHISRSPSIRSTVTLVTPFSSPVTPFCTSFRTDFSHVSLQKPISARNNLLCMTSQETIRRKLGTNVYMKTVTVTCLTSKLRHVGKYQEHTINRTFFFNTFQAQWLLYVPPG